MRYRLRTLLMVTTVGPLALTFVWYVATVPSKQSGLAIFLAILSAIVGLIAYWPRICGKGG